MKLRLGICITCLRPFLLVPRATVADSKASAVDDVVGRVDLGDDDGSTTLLRNTDARAGPRYQDKSSRNTRPWENDGQGSGEGNIQVAGREAVGLGGSWCKF